jgi:hypothetical protein
MPKTEFFRRIEALWQSCPTASHALVCGTSRHHAELAYLSNLVPKLDPAVAILSRAGEPRLFVGGGPNMLPFAREHDCGDALAPTICVNHLRHCRVQDRGGCANGGEFSRRFAAH